MVADGDSGADPGASGRRRLAELGPGWISAIAGLVGALAAVAGLVIAGSGSNGPDDPGAEPVTARALPPASAPPQVELCREQLTFAVDGTAGPIACPGGELNVLAWEHYAQLDRLVMSLGPEAGPVQVGQAMCSDLTLETTIPEETEAYRLARLYNSWDFALEPTEVFPDNC